MDTHESGRTVASGPAPGDRWLQIGGGSSVDVHSLIIVLLSQRMGDARDYLTES